MFLFRDAGYHANAKNVPQIVRAAVKPTVNGTLRHQDIFDLELSQRAARAQEKDDKYCIEGVTRLTACVTPSCL